VQWNLSAEDRAIGLETAPGKTDAEIARIREYEQVATRYSIQLLHEADVRDLDRWASDWWDADFRWLAHYYRTGEKADFRTFLRPGEGELLTPLAIPAFTPQRWVSRWSF
jgi:hypothetical protein